VGHLAEDAGIELLVDTPAEEVIAEVDPRRGGNAFCAT